VTEAWPFLSVDAAGAPNEQVKTAQITVLPPEATPKHKRTKLGDLRAIRAELAKVYRAVKRGEMDTSTGTRLTYILTQLANLTIDSQIEERLERLELGR